MYEKVIKKLCDSDSRNRPHKPIVYYLLYLTTVGGVRVQCSFLGGCVLHAPHPRESGVDELAFRTHGGCSFAGRNGLQ